MRIPSTKTDQLIYFVAVDSTDLKTRETGLTSFTVYRSRNGGAATVYTTPTVAELSAANMPGVYSLAIDEDTTIGGSSDSEEYCVHITQAAMAPVTRVIELYRRDTTSGQTATVANGAIDADIERIQGTVVSTPATAGILDVNVKNIDNDLASAAGTVTFPNATLASTTNITAGTLTTVNTATNVTTLNGIAANVITAASINTGAITAAKFAAGAIDAAALATDAGAEIAAAVWDMDATAHQTQGTFGQAIGDPVADTNTIYKAVVTDATGATVGIDVVAVKAETASIQADTDNIQTRLPAALTADGNMKTDTLYMNGAVWLDTATGAPGTVNFSNGTLVNPSSSMADSRTIANSLDLKSFHINNASLITLDQGYIGYSFLGEKWILALANRNITSSYFRGAKVSGLSTGTGAVFEACDIGSVTVMQDTIFSSCSISGTLTVGAAGIIALNNCYGSLVSGVDTVVDFAAVGASTVTLREWSGGVEVLNMAAGDVFACNGMGRVTLNASCTAGSIFLAGNMSLIDNSTGTSITDGARWHETQNIASVTGAVGSVTAAVTVGTINANVLNASALAADAVTEIQAGLALSTQVDALEGDVTAIKAKTDSLTFTVAARLDANVRNVNSVLVTGTGAPGDEWGP